MKDEFEELLSRATDSDPIYDPVKRAAVEEALNRHQWEDRAKDVSIVLGFFHLFALYHVK